MKKLVLIAAGFVFGLQSFGGVITITGETRDANGALQSLTVSFPAAAKASTIWFASDTADRGELIGDWKHVEYSAAVAQGATSCVCPVSGCLKNGAPVMKAFLLEDRADGAVELESLSSDGAASVPTGLAPSASTRVVCDFKFDALTSCAIFGARSAGGQNSFCLLNILPNPSNPSAGHGWRYDCGTVMENTGVDPAVDTRYLVEMDYSNGLRVNGVRTGTKNGGGTVSPGGNLVVFAMRTVSASPQVGSVATATLYSLKAYTGSELTLDLVPCRTNNVLGLINRKSGWFMPGTGGTLTAGAAKEHSSLGTIKDASAAFNPFNGVTTLNITASTRDEKGLLSSLTLAFPPTAKPSSVWLVCDTVDRGDNIGDWEYREFAATVPQGATSCICPVGACLKRGASVMRAFLVEANEDDSLVELESVSSTNGAYVETGFKPSGLSRVWCDFRFDVLKGSALFGARESTSANQFCMLEVGTNGLRYDYGWTQVNSLHLPVLGRRYTAEMDYRSLRIDGTVWWNCSRAENAVTFSHNYNLYIFAVNTAGTATAPADATIYAFKAYNDDGTISLNLVPCKKNDVAGLYNVRTGYFMPSKDGDKPLTAGVPKEHSVLGTVRDRSAVFNPYGNDRTLTVAKSYRIGHRVKADLTLTAGGLSDSYVVAAYGPEDGGGQLSNWSNTVVLAVAPADATALTVTVPETITDDNQDEMRFFRYFLVQRFGNAGAYDRLVEGLHATGTQYIVTDFTPTKTTEVSAKFMMDNVTESQVLMSARTKALDHSFTVMHLADSGFRYDFANFNYAADSTKANWKMTANTPFTFYAAGYLKINDNQTENVAVVPDDATRRPNFTAGSPLTIFALNSAGTVNTCAKAVCYWLVVFSQSGGQNRTLQLKPCEKDGELGLVNELNGKFYGNSGTGAFEAYGKEKANLEAPVSAQSATIACPMPPGLSLILR